MVTLNELKTYLRVDYNDEDGLLEQLIDTATELCAHIVRCTVAELSEMEDDNVHTAELYAAAYLYEHREEADHHGLTLTLRSLLFGVRKAGF